MGNVNRISPRMYFFFSRVFPLLFIMVGAVALYFGVNGLYLARESVTWPVADGTIKNATVEYHSGERGAEHTTLKSFTNLISTERPTAETKSPMVTMGRVILPTPREIVNRYPIGKTVKVHYLPSNPDTCVLETGVQTQAWFLPAFGALFFVVGSLMAVFLPKIMRTNANTKRIRA